MVISVNCKKIIHHANLRRAIKFISSYTLKKLKEKEFKFTFKKPFLICVENDFWPKFKIIILNNQNSEITWFPKIRDIQKLIFFKIIEILEEQDIEGTFEQIQTSIIDPFCMLLKKEAITIETNPL